jgi:fido (protein-threonine AMPylation protein)
VRRAADEPDARFYAAGGLSARQTTEEARDNVARLLVSIVDQGRRQPPITPSRLRAWHRAVFGRLFPEDAGRWRQAHEDVAFPVLVEAEGSIEPVIVTGAPARDIEEAVAGVCGRLEVILRAAELRSPPDSAAAGTALADFMAELLRVHPFVDGNHRVALVAAQATFVRLTGQPVLWGADYAALEETLEVAIVDEEGRRRLARLFERRLAEPPAG